MGNKELTPRSQNQAQWYQEVVKRAQLADYSPVRGCMVIRPYGYAIWEKVQADMDKRIKAMGAQNAYFPIFIPTEYFAREADHVEGFAPELATVTHVGDKELEQKLAVRPTSETMFYEMYSQWLESYRDLPMKLNQWANVVRWEKRTQPFLRTTEFLWQEGHTIHASKEEAEAQVNAALDNYYEFITDKLAMYVTKGYKTEAEKFAGAEYTMTLEGMMADGKALQSVTSHLLNQSFAKSFDVTYIDEDGEEQVVWPTSWGLSTRIIGGLILQHGDDKGLVLPPKIAPVQVIIVPIVNEDNKQEIAKFVEKVVSELKQADISYEIDWSDNSPGFKFSEAEMRGIPVRLEVGPKDMAKNSVLSVRRVDGEKKSLALTEIPTQLAEIFTEIQEIMYTQAKQFTEDATVQVESYEEFKQVAAEHKGYIRAFFNGDPELEDKIQQETKFKSSCIPLETYEQEGKCLLTGEAGKLTLFAKSY